MNQRAVCSEFPRKQKRDHQQKEKAKTENQN